MCAGRFGSRVAASKSITPSNAPLLRIHWLTAWCRTVVKSVLTQLDPARRAVGKKPDAAAPGNARIVPRLFTAALGGGLSAWAHATSGDSEARLRRLLLGTRKIPF